MKTLEEFWYGNIEPSEYDAFPGKEYKEALRLVTRNEEKLQATMTDEQVFVAPVSIPIRLRLWQE